MNRPGNPGDSLDWVMPHSSNENRSVFDRPFSCRNVTGIDPEEEAECIEGLGRFTHYM